MEKETKAYGFRLRGRADLVLLEDDLVELPLLEDDLAALLPLEDELLLLDV